MSMEEMEEIRFETPLYTFRRTAWYLDVPEETLRRWAGRHSPWQLVTAEQAQQSRGRLPIMPFIGLAEAFVVRAFRQHAGGKRLPVDRVMGYLQFIQEHGGVEHALASERFFFHGSDFLYDFSEQGAKERELAEALTKNGVLEHVVENHLESITYREGWAGAVILPFTRRPVAVADPLRAFGEPMFLEGDARVIDVLDRFDAGDDPDELADDFDVPLADVLEIVRAASRKGRQAA